MHTAAMSHICMQKGYNLKSTTYNNLVSQNEWDERHNGENRLEYITKSLIMKSRRVRGRAKV